MGASQWTTATVSGRPSPSRSPDACFFTTCCTGPQSKGNSTPAGSGGAPCAGALLVCGPGLWAAVAEPGWNSDDSATRSEEHTSELQSREKLVCRLLLE